MEGGPPGTAGSRWCPTPSRTGHASWPIRHGDGHRVGHGALDRPGRIASCLAGMGDAQGVAVRQTVQCLLDWNASCPPDMGAGGPRPAAPQDRPVDGLTWASTGSGDGTRARPRLRPTSCLPSWAMTARHGGPRRRGSAIRRPVGPSDMATAGRGTGPLCMAGRCPPGSTPDTGTFARHLAHQGGSAVLQGGGPAGRDTSWVQKLTDWRCRGGEVRRWARGLGGCGAWRQGSGPSGRRLGLTSRQFALAEGDTVGRRLRCSTDRPVGQLAMAHGET